MMMNGSGVELYVSSGPQGNHRMGCNVRGMYVFTVISLTRANYLSERVPGAEQCKRVMLLYGARCLAEEDAEILVLGNSEA